MQFWSCPCLTQYLQSVLRTFSCVSYKLINPWPVLALLGVGPEGSVPPELSKAFVFSTLLSRRLILENWKQQNHPTFIQQMRDLISFLHLEKIRNKLWPLIKKVETRTKQPTLEEVVHLSTDLKSPP